MIIGVTLLISKTKMSGNSTFLGLTAKVEIPDIYTLKDIDEFNESLTPEEKIQYNSNCEKTYKGLERIITKFSKVPNKDVILGLDIYEKQYPDDEFLFDCLSQRNLF